MSGDRTGLAGRIARHLLVSPIVPLFVVACLMLGGYSLIVTPREDRPDIDVPTATILIPWPGAGVERVDNQLARKAAGWVQELASVSEVRSSSSSHGALLSVEFEAGTAKDKAFARLDELFGARANELPATAGSPTIETFGESRLVVLMATLSSKIVGPDRLQDMATELSTDLLRVPGVRDVERFGGDKAAIEILPDPAQLAARKIPLTQVAEAVAGANRQVPTGRLEGRPVTDLQAGISLDNLGQLGRVPVGNDGGGPVYLEQVAQLRAGRVQQNQAVLHWQQSFSAPYPAVTLAVTTLAGRNVSDITRNVVKRLQAFSDDTLPSDVHLDITHDAGADATKRVYSVLSQLLSGTLVVVGIIWLGLGWRAAVVIAIMMPASLAIVPYIYNYLGFTLNPVSIAAMILAIGILSDDAVVMLENVARHSRRAGEKTRGLIVKAIDEVGNPTILADLLVVATLLPTAYISGEMGQYVRAIPIGASAAVLFSLVVALTITPYFSYRLLTVKKTGDKQDETGDKESPFVARYRSLMGPFLDFASLRWLLYLGLIALLLASFSLVALRTVQIGLTPLLDRNVFAIEVELPAGATLTDSLRAASDLNRHLARVAEVRGVTVYAGLMAPMIYPPETLTSPERKSPADLTLHVNLLPEGQRERQSYQINREIAGNLGDWLSPHHARGHIGRIPSGPSSERAITAEIYGRDRQSRQAAADKLEQWLARQEGVIATSQSPTAALPRLNLHVDPERAATFGVLPAAVTRTLRLAIAGETLGDWANRGSSRDPVPMILRLEKADRDSEQAIRSLYASSRQSEPVSLESVLDFEHTAGEEAVFRRNLMPITTVFADLDRSVMQPTALQMESFNSEQWPDIDMRWLNLPADDRKTIGYWAGEWEMTRDVYRDMGLAGLVVMIIIYVLLAGWFRSYPLPILIMLPIPLIFIGVIPAHWLWGINIAGTGVLGVIALGGIVTRNAILLVDFVHQRLDEGMQLREAVIQAGAQRTRPILLTAATVMFGSGVLIFEPALEPLGLTLASGVFVSTGLTLILVPVLYYHAFRNHPGSRPR